MPTVVRFLESLGSKAPVSDYAAAVAALVIGEGERAALMDRNVVVLNGLVGAREEMRCLIYSGDPS